MKRFAALAIAALLLSACDEEVSRAMPDPMILTDEAAGYYCQMEILGHDGPKGQLFLEGMLAPLWFSQVRDGLAYVKSPEQEGEIIVLYVNDMGAATAWDTPGPDNWIDANDAFYVVGSDAIGGMGAPEMVPFGTKAGAEEFAALHGGEILKIDEITVESVLSPVDHGTDQEISE